MSNRITEINHRVRECAAGGLSIQDCTERLRAEFHISLEEAKLAVSSHLAYASPALTDEALTATAADVAKVALDDV